MSMFGESRMHMEYLHDYIDDFFQEGGTLSEFFEVLEYSFRHCENPREINETEIERKNNLLNEQLQRINKENKALKLLLKDTIESEVNE